MSLFKLPWVTNTLASPAAALKMAAIISLTVVLPLLPVTMASGKSYWPRHACASSPKLERVLLTQTAGKSSGHFSLSLINAALAPA